jgi:hypothetical protein
VTRSRRWQVAGHPRAAIWPWLHARDARGCGVRRRVAGQARDRFADSRLGAAQRAWGRAEGTRARGSTAEAPLHPYAGGTCGRRVARGDVGSLLDSTYPASKLQNSKKCQLS